MKREEATSPGAPDTGAHQLRRTIRALARRFELSERADVSCCGMTVAQAAALEALRAAGPTRPGALGTSLGIQPSTVTRNLDRLEERGLVRRVADPQDARAALVRLTPAGEAAAREVDRQATEFFESILERLPPGRREAVLESLGELLEAVRQATESCCSGAFEHLLPRADKAQVRSRS